MNEERFQYLLSKKLAGEAHADELEELARLVEVDPELEMLQRTMQQFWENSDPDQSVDVERSFQQIQHLITTASEPVQLPEQTRKRIPSWVYYCTAAAALIGFILLIYRVDSEPAPVAIEKQEPLVPNAIAKHNGKGVRSSIELPDGSKVWLNADSKLEYPPAFNQSVREVYLTGEAYFDVRKNPLKPFVIHLSRGQVRVLGTSFNIRAYQNEKRIITSVSSGKVVFVAKKSKQMDSQDTVVLIPNEKAVYDWSNDVMQKIQTVGVDDRAWIDGKLIFRDKSFEEIAIELERSFGKKILFLDESLKQRRLTGSFQGNNLEEILFYLSLGSPFTYQLDNNEVLIGPVSGQ